MHRQSNSSIAGRSPMLSEAERLAALHLLLGSGERAEIRKVVRFLLRRAAENLDRSAGKGSD